MPKPIQKATPKKRNPSRQAMRDAGLIPHLKKGKNNHQGEGGGRPSKKNLLDLSMVETFYSFGLIDEQICKALDITGKTLENWKKDEKFLQAIKKGKVIADARVERALYERATGYTHPEDDIRTVGNQIVITHTLKHYPPDSTSMIFWLKNRKKAEWRDKTEVEHDMSGSIMAAVASHLSQQPEKVEKEAKIHMGKAKKSQPKRTSRAEKQGKGGK